MRFYEILNELRYLPPQLLKNVVGKLIREPQQNYIRAVGLLSSQLSNEELYKLVQDKIMSADPSPNKQYIQWIAKTYVNNSVLLEDVLSRYADALEKYHLMKPRLTPPGNNINTFTSFIDLEKFVEGNQSLIKTKKEEINRGKAKELYNDNAIRIIVPEDETAACYYGQGTKWCTAAKNNNQFDSYARGGSLYIIFPKQPKYPGEKYQLHFKSASVMNEKDSPVKAEVLVKRWPQLTTAFETEIWKHGALNFMVPAEMIKIRNRIGKLAIEKFSKFKEDPTQFIYSVQKLLDTSVGVTDEEAHGIYDAGMEGIKRIPTSIIGNLVKSLFSEPITLTYYILDEDVLYDATYQDLMDFDYKNVFFRYIERNYPNDYDSVFHNFVVDLVDIFVAAIQQTLTEYGVDA